MAPRLTTLNALKLRAYPLAKRKTTIGCTSENDIVICEPTVSRQHALIKRRFRRYWLVDLESTNGTAVNHRPVRNPTLLARGDELSFGAARFVFLESPDTRELTRRISLTGLLAVMAAVFVTTFAVTEYFINRSLLQKFTIPFSSHTDVSKRPAIGGDASVSASRSLSPDKPAVVRPVLPTVTPLSTDSGPDWLRELNHWRTMAGVPLVRDDSYEIRGATAHARYMVKNYLAGNPETPHHEAPSNPWYTPEGGKVAPKGDEYGPGTGSLKSPIYDVDGWTDGAFHRLGLLARDLTAASYGDYCENKVCASVLVLDLHQDSDTDPTWFGKFPEPVMFPSNGATLPETQTTLISDEWPEPLSLSCTGYSRPAGYPITLQFDGRFVPKLLSSGLTRDGVAVPVCGYASDSYTNSDGATQEWGRGVLKGEGAIVLIPREPLKPGAIYTVTVNVQGEADPFGWGSTSPFAGQTRSYTWFFSLAS